MAQRKYWSAVNLKRSSKPRNSWIIGERVRIGRVSTREIQKRFRKSWTMCSWWLWWWSCCMLISILPMTKCPIVMTICPTPNAMPVIRTLPFRLYPILAGSMPMTLILLCTAVQWRIETIAILYSLWHYLFALWDQPRSFRNFGLFMSFLATKASPWPLLFWSQVFFARGDLACVYNMQEESSIYLLYLLVEHLLTLL